MKEQKNTQSTKWSDENNDPILGGFVFEFWERGATVEKNFLRYSVIASSLDKAKLKLKSAGVSTDRISEQLALVVKERF